VSGGVTSRDTPCAPPPSTWPVLVATPHTPTPATRSSSKTCRGDENIQQLMYEREDSPASPVSSDLDSPSRNTLSALEAHYLVRSNRAPPPSSTEGGQRPPSVLPDGADNVTTVT